MPTLNCPSWPQDFTNPDQFGIIPGSEGENIADGNFICADFPHGGTVAVMSPADAGNEASFPASINPTVAKCGDKVTYQWIPFTVVDVAPYVAKIVGQKPVVVMGYFSGASALNTFEDFKEDGYPLSHFISAGGTDLNPTILDAIPKSLLQGVYFSSEIVNWSETSNPDVQEFLKQTAGVSDNLTQNVEDSWLMATFLADAARQIGAAKLSPATMEHYLATANGVHIRLSRSWTNPGASGYPDIHQGDGQVYQYLNGHLTLVTKGSVDGWYNGD